MATFMVDDPITPQTLDDFEPEPDDHADALEIGQRIYGRMRDTLIDAAAASLAFQDDKSETKKLKTALGRNPAHFITAIERFPELFGDDSSADIYEILGALALSKVKDDDTALALYEEWRGDGSKSLDDLKASIKEASPERERKPTLAERCAELIEAWGTEADEQPNPYAGEPDNGDLQARSIFRVCANELAALPEVAKVLEAKDAA